MIKFSYVILLPEGACCNHFSSNSFLYHAFNITPKFDGVSMKTSQICIDLLTLLIVIINKNIQSNQRLNWGRKAKSTFLNAFSLHYINL